MATAGDDFEKGDANGAHASLALAAHVAQLLGASNAPGHVPAKQVADGRQPNHR
jgi:hypothetical protein